MNLKTVDLRTILSSTDGTKEYKYIVHGGILLPEGIALLDRAISFLQVQGWTPMRRISPTSRDIFGALQAADGDRYPKTSPEFKMVVCAICKQISYEAIHIWEYNGGAYRTQEEVIGLLREARANHLPA